MTKAIRIHEHGGPEVMKYEDVEVGSPGPGRSGYGRPQSA